MRRGHTIFKTAHLKHISVTLRNRSTDFLLCMFKYDSEIFYNHYKIKDTTFKNHCASSFSIILNVD